MCVRQPFRTDSLTDRGDEGGREGVVREPEQNAGLPDAGIANQQQLKQQVVRFLGHFALRSELARPSLGLFTVGGGVRLSEHGSAGPGDNSSFVCFVSSALVYRRPAHSAALISYKIAFSFTRRFLDKH